MPLSDVSAQYLARRAALETQPERRASLLRWRSRILGGERAEDGFQSVSDALELDAADPRTLFLAARLQEESGRPARAAGLWRRLAEVSEDRNVVLNCWLVRDFA